MKNKCNDVLVLLMVVFWSVILSCSNAQVPVSVVPNTSFRVNPCGAVRASFRVTNVEPSKATALAVTSSTAMAWFSEAVAADTVTTNRCLVYGAWSGFHDKSISLSNGNQRLQLDPVDPFAVGEKITTWLTSGITNSAGSQELPHYSWTYRKAVSAGSASFTNSGQSFFNKEDQRVALGDLDGDGDIDVMTGGRYSTNLFCVWLNDGIGNLSKGFEFPVMPFAMDMDLGDLDGDRDLDVVFAVSDNSLVTNFVWLNDGTGSFSVMDLTNSLCRFTAVSLGDLDGNGSLDAFFLNQGENRVWFNIDGILVDTGQRLGSFDGYPEAVALADLDGDGDLDAYEGKAYGSRIWLNQGNGYFVDSGQTCGVSTVYAITLGDVDGDGDQDVFNVTDTESTLWLNDGSANFTNSGQSFGDVYGGAGASMGDLDNDGDLDIICQRFREKFVVFINNGAGVFSQHDTTMSPVGGRMGLGDMDADGDLDVYAVGVLSSNPDILWINENPYYALLGVNGSAITNDEAAELAKGTDFGVVSNGTERVHIFSITNSGPGVLPVDAVYTNGLGTPHFRCTDMPTRIEAGTVSNFTVVFAPVATTWGRHNADLRIVNHGCHDTQMIVRLQGVGLPPSVTNTMPLNAACSVGRASNITARFSEPMLAATVTSNTFVLHSGQSGLRRGTVDLEAGVQTAVLDPSMPLRPGELVFGSLPKAMTNQPGCAPLRPFAWSFYAAADAAPGLFHSSGPALGSAPTRSVALGDLDGDGDLDALAGNNGAPSRAWFNDGAGSFTQGVQELTSAYTYDVALGDLDLDGDIDVFQVNYNQPDRVWLNNGDGTFTDSGQALGASRGLVVTLGDVDGDADLDAFVGCWAQPVQLWLNDGLAHFTAGEQSLGSSICSDAVCGDLNQDGFLDIFLGVMGANEVWTNNGFGLIFDTGQELGNAVTYGVALGDVDGDGDLDAYAANSGEPHILWLNDGYGVFSDSGQSLGSSFGTDAAFGDVNGDGDLDLVLASDWQQPAEVWTNSGTGLFYNSGQALGNQSRYAVALGDLDDDGDIDAFFGNNGSCDAWFNGVVYYTLTGVADGHGSITPEGPVMVAAGGSTSFVAYADTYYWIDAMTVAGSARVEAAHMKGYTCLCESVYCDATAMVVFAEALAAHGTPELWLVQYGWTNNFDYWELQDTDGDDFQAWEEQVAGTDPTNAASYLQLTGCESLGNGKMLDWNGVSGRVYSILVNTNLLGAGPWSSVTSNLPPTGTWTDTTDHAEADLFYRLGVERAP